MLPFNGLFLLLFGLVFAQGRPDEAVRLANSNSGADSTPRDLVRTADSVCPADGLARVINSASFCIENSLVEVTILLKSTYKVDGKSRDGSTTAKSGATSSLTVPDNAKEIIFSIYVNDHKPPIYLFNVTFPNISKMENSCLKYKVTQNGYYPDCISQS